MLKSLLLETQDFTETIPFLILIALKNANGGSLTNDVLGLSIGE
jgi:hypothetical protein